MQSTVVAHVDQLPLAESSPPALSLTDVRRFYGKGEGEVRALNGVSLSFARGSFTAVMGPSGSGKSTLLQCGAGLDQPTSGRIEVGTTVLDGLGERNLAALRRDHVGFIFQSFNLLEALTAEQNVALPSRLAKRKLPRKSVRAALDRVGMGERVRHRPAELSGGQQQRVAIARALVGQPDLIFADEPTGALDLKAGRSILALLRQTVDEGNRTLVMVTHDPSAAAWADRVVFLADGLIAGELTSPTPAEVAEHLTRLES